MKSKMQLYKALHRRRVTNGVDGAREGNGWEMSDCTMGCCHDIL